MQQETALVTFALFLIALLQGYNWSKIERIESEYEVLKKTLAEIKGMLTNGR